MQRVLALFILCATACGPGRVHQDKSCAPACPAGSVCRDSACIALCVTDEDCAEGRFCKEGACLEPLPGEEPSVHSVSGNDPADPGRVIDGLRIEGSALGLATFALVSDSGSTPLRIRRQTEAEVEVVLPADVRSGTHTLVSTNQAGSVETLVTLELPELDGDVLLERINGASGMLSHTLIPTGTTADSVATGDHNHDAAYYPRSQADALFLSPQEASALYYSRSESDSAFLTADEARTSHYTRDEADAAFYSRSEADARFMTPAQSDAAHYSRAEADTAFLSPTEGDAAYYTRGEADTTFLTPAEGDTAYYPRDDADTAFLTPAEGDAAYYPRGEADMAFVSPAEGDSAYVRQDGGDVVGHLGVSGRLAVGVSPVASAKLHIAASFFEPVFLSGTVSANPGSDAVIGNGTLFTSELRVGDEIDILSDRYTVTAIASDSILTITPDAGPGFLSAAVSVANGEALRIESDAGERWMSVDRWGDTHLAKDLVVAGTIRSIDGLRAGGPAFYVREGGCYPGDTTVVSRTAPRTCNGCAPCTTGWHGWDQGGPAETCTYRVSSGSYCLASRTCTAITVALCNP